MYRSALDVRNGTLPWVILLKEFAAKILYADVRANIKVSRAQFTVTVINKAECVGNCVLHLERRLFGLLPNFLKYLFLCFCLKCFVPQLLQLTFLYVLNLAR